MHEGFHHLHVRKRIYRNLEKFPSTSALKRGFDYLMYVVAILGPMALLPQVISIYSTQNVDGLVPLTWLLLAGINAMWVMYATLHREAPVAIASVIAGVLNIAGLTGILMFST